MIYMSMVYVVRYLELGNSMVYIFAVVCAFIMSVTIHYIHKQEIEITMKRSETRVRRRFQIS